MLRLIASFFEALVLQPVQLLLAFLRYLQTE